MFRVQLSAADLPAARRPQRLREEIFAILDGEEDRRPRPKAKRTAARPRKKKDPAPGPHRPSNLDWTADFE